MCTHALQLHHHFYTNVRLSDANGSRRSSKISSIETVIERSTIMATLFMHRQHLKQTAQHLEHQTEKSGHSHSACFNLPSVKLEKTPLPTLTNASGMLTLAEKNQFIFEMILTATVSAKRLFGAYATTWLSRRHYIHSISFSSTHLCSDFFLSLFVRFLLKSTPTV